MPPRTLAFALGAALLAAPAVLDAQELTLDSAPVERPPICFRGGPLPRCRAFWLVEMGWYQRVLGPSVSITRHGEPPTGPSYRARASESYLAWEVGGMVNRDARSAVGGTVLLGTDGEGEERVGVKGRYRRWLSPRTALDLSGGVLRGAVPDPPFEPHVGGFGVTADAGYQVADLVAVSARVDVLHAGGRTYPTLYAGGRLGSYPAVAGTVVLAGLVAWAIAALAGAHT